MKCVIQVIAILGDAYRVGIVFSGIKIAKKLGQGTFASRQHLFSQ